MTDYTQPPPLYIVMEASVKVSSKMTKYGTRYRAVRVVQTDETTWPQRSNAKSVIEVVYDSGPQAMGKTERSAFAIAKAHAIKLAADLNARLRPLTTLANKAATVEETTQ